MIDEGKDFVKRVLNNKEICNEFDDIIESAIFSLFDTSESFRSLYEEYRIENLPDEESMKILNATFLGLLDNFKKNYYGCD
jgi:uncharacterized protein YfbU (UPF0304 family)